MFRTHLIHIYLPVHTRYVDQELYNPIDMESPFSRRSSYMEILTIMRQIKAEGLPVQGLVEACKQLADAQSRRSAVAAQILPVVHWVRQLSDVFEFRPSNP